MQNGLMAKVLWVLWVKEFTKALNVSEQDFFKFAQVLAIQPLSELT